MATTYIKSIQAKGIFGRFDVEQKFEEGINIIYGKNGAGKTTLLHILANALSGDFERFNHLQFDEIIIKLSDKRTLVIKRQEKESIRSNVEVTLNNDVIYPIVGNLTLSKMLNEKGGIDKYDIILGRELDMIQDILKDSTDRSEQISFIKEYFTDHLLKNKTSLSQNEISKIWERLILNFSSIEKERSSLFSIAYFPAFRTMIEAWAATSASKDTRTRVTQRPVSDEWKFKATEQARDWFGAFTPTVNFPSLVEIEDQLTSEIFRARLAVGNKDRDLLSEAFLKVFGSLSDRSLTLEKGDNILGQIQELFLQLEASPMGMASTPIYRDLRKELSKLHTKEGKLEPSAIRILKIYRDVLESSLNEQQGSFASIERYIDSVNEFLENKKTLAYKLDESSNRQKWLGVKFEDGSFTSGLRTLSSGERQIITLIYASSHMSQQNIVLIDEPEISLHIDWQRKLISKMAEQIGNRQIIACTHSPVVAADYQDQMKEFQFKPSRSKTKVLAGNPAVEGE